jgi:stress-induced morphogen
MFRAQNIVTVFRKSILPHTTAVSQRSSPVITKLDPSVRRRTMSSSASFPVTESIRQKLTDAFHPQVLQVINESHMHNVPKNSETHFKVVVVSDQFETIKSPLQRHRMINGTLSSELQGPVHALSIIAKTPAQWEKDQTVPASPNCKGGDGSLPKKSSSSSS